MSDLHGVAASASKSALRYCGDNIREESLWLSPRVVDALVEERHQMRQLELGI